MSKIVVDVTENGKLIASREIDVGHLLAAIGDSSQSDTMKAVALLRATDNLTEFVRDEILSVAKRIADE